MFFFSRAIPREIEAMLTCFWERVGEVYHTIPILVSIQEEKKEFFAHGMSR
jgi:hypothetical protein